MERARALVDRTLASALVALMAIMVANVLWQVFTRFVLGTPSSYTEELARYLLIWTSLLGAAYASGQKMHLAIDLLTPRLTEQGRARAAVFIHACVFLFAFGVMVVGGIRLVYISFVLQQISAALRISLGIVYLAVPLSGALIVFYAAAVLFGPREPLPPPDTAPHAVPPRS